MTIDVPYNNSVYIYILLLQEDRKMANKMGILRIKNAGLALLVHVLMMGQPMRDWLAGVVRG